MFGIQALGECGTGSWGGASDEGLPEPTYGSLWQEAPAEVGNSGVEGSGG